MPPANLVVTPLQSIVWTSPSGKVLRWNFDSEGYVTSFSDGDNAVRYHHHGLITYGFDVKLPSQGYPNFTPVLSTTWNDDGYILSSTWHPTGQTTTYDAPVPAPVESEPIGPGTLGQQAITQQPTRPPTKVELCKRAVNDNSEVNRANYRTCIDNVVNTKNQCLVAAGIGGVLSGAGAGAAIGLEIGGVGALPGAIGGAILGADAAVIGCHAAAIVGLNQCTDNFNRGKNDIRTTYYRCVIRAYEDAGVKSSQRLKIVPRGK